MSKKLIQAAAGAGGESVYVEDVFSTYLYTGNGTTQTITNGIDLDGEGGLVWLKCRSLSNTNNNLTDTVRGTERQLWSDSTNAEWYYSGNGITSFNDDGFSLTGGNDLWNYSSATYASWTFRKAEKFCDVLTYTGTGLQRNISHNLGSTPACIIIKRTDATGRWIVHHIGLSAPNSSFLTLNSTATQDGNGGMVNGTSSTTFSVGTENDVNFNGGTFVAYLFASDAGGFGDDDESIIKCGSYTGTGATGNQITLGWEPQWVMVKRTDSADDWNMQDMMRSGFLRANTSEAELGGTGWFNVAGDNLFPTSTGFQINTAGPEWNASGGTYIYIAIRRPMKTPEAGTDVYGASQDSTPTFSFPPDLAMIFDASGGSTYHNKWTDRLRGSQNTLQTSSTAAEVAESSANTFYTFSADGNQNTFGNSWGGPTYTIQGFKRATGFFDVVAYTGDGTFGGKNHNLGVVPELIINKGRNSTQDWYVWLPNSASPGYGFLRTTSAFTNFNIAATSTTFDPVWDTSSNTYIAYLFATLAGISKVGSYSGTGSNVDVDCGFTAGARFILIKRTDSTGDWYVWDSARGIVAGNDPYLLLNSTAAEVTTTDYIDPLSSGFTVTSSAPAALNTSGGTYIFLAIA